MTTSTAGVRVTSMSAERAMSDEKLIRWLRNFVGPGSNGTNQAADRIESLQAELAEARAERDELEEQQNEIALALPEEYDGDESQFALILRFVQETRRGVAQRDELRAVIEQVRSLYKARCKATVTKYTEAEEMFLADISRAIERES